MSTTAQISLHKALKLKNRLAGRLATVTSEIQMNNSVLADDAQNPSRPNVKDLLEQRQQIVGALIDLKISHYNANQGIQRQLYTLGEKKAELSFLAGLNTHEGVDRHGYQNTEVKYVATIKKPEVDAARRKLEAEIDALQDEIDAYNYTTKVEVAQATLDLGS
jgi:hypothetical protein